MPLFRGEYEVSDELLNDLRSKFLEEVNSSPEAAAKYHPDDIQRVKENDWFISRYLLHQDLDFDKALKMLRVSLQFRHEIDINTLKKEDLPESYFEDRILQIYNFDKKNFPVLIMRAKDHRKCSEMRRQQYQYVMYWIEKATRQDEWGGISVLFDCSDVSLTYVDLEMSKFIFNIFNQYYPWTMNIYMIYNMPWYLTVIWKIVKTWIPEKYSNRVIFVDQNSLLEYIEKDQLPVCMGGTCTDQYDPKVVEETSE